MGVRLSGFGEEDGGEGEVSEVYIVTRGSYSDYSIAAVFSTEKKAWDFVRYWMENGNPWDWRDAEVETREIDPHGRDLKDNLAPYFVRMDRDGNTSQLFECRETASEGNTGFDRQGNLYMHPRARDKKHAVKIVNERRGRILAENKWGDQHWLLNAMGTKYR